jgi:hypothetical protein
MLSDSRPPRTPCWQLYIYCVATLGLYLPVWTYRMIVALEPGRRWRAVGWGLGTLFPVFGWVVLLELGRLAEEWSGERRRRRGGSAVMPALWLVLLALVLWLTPLRAVVTASALVIPLPFLAIQATINAGYFADPLGPSPPQRWPAWRRWPLVAVGAGLSMAAARYVDRAAYSFAATLASADGRGARRLFSFKPPRGWLAVAPGTFGDADAELELARLDKTAWLVAYVWPGSHETLDGAVARRRAVIGAESDLTGLVESRGFLAESDRPISWAFYGLGRFPQNAAMWVGTVLAENATIELLVYSALPERDQALVPPLFDTLRLVPRGKK